MFPKFVGLHTARIRGNDLFAVIGEEPVLAFSGIFNALANVNLILILESQRWRIEGANFGR